MLGGLNRSLSGIRFVLYVQDGGGGERGMNGPTCQHILLLYTWFRHNPLTEHRVQLFTGRQDPNHDKIGRCISED